MYLLASARKISAPQTQSSFVPGTVWDSGTKNEYDPFPVLRNRAIQEHKAEHKVSFEKPENTVMETEEMKKTEGFPFW